MSRAKKPPTATIPATPDPRETAATAVEQAAAGGDMVAARLMAEGIIDVLRRRPPEEQIPRHGETRIDCPGCSARLLIRYDSHECYVAHSVIPISGGERPADAV